MKPPASLTVFGILNLVFGAIGVFGIVSSYAMMRSPLVANNPGIKLMKEQPEYLAWMNIAMPLGFVAALLVIVSGVGLLKARNWARQLAIGYAIFAIVSSIVSTVITYRYVALPMLEQAKNSQGPEAAGAIGGAIGGVIGDFFSLIYPVILLIFMTRPKIVAACTQTPPPLPL